MLTYLPGRYISNTGQKLVQCFQQTCRMLSIVIFISILFTMECKPFPIVMHNEVESPINVIEPEGDSEFGGHFEGDMLLTTSQIQAITDALRGRNGLRDGSKRWPNKTVVYYIEEDDFDDDQLKMIEDGMADIANKSCIRFAERQGKEYSLKIQGSKKGCFSNVGYRHGNDEEEDSLQVLNLAKGCFKKHGTIVHEMLHTLGFYHMQSTYDRDNYVQIIWDNIEDGREHNFKKYNNDTLQDFGISYDYDSVMHYPEKAFSKNGNNTIIPLQEDAVIGQRKGMSERDIVKLNKMYCENVDNESD